MGLLADCLAGVQVALESLLSEWRLALLIQTQDNVAASLPRKRSTNERRRLSRAGQSLTRSRRAGSCSINPTGFSKSLVWFISNYNHHRLEHVNEF